jgi:hypothetical protein
MIHTAHDVSHHALLYLRVGEVPRDARPDAVLLSQDVAPICTTNRAGDSDPEDLAHLLQFPAARLLHGSCLSRVGTAPSDSRLEDAFPWRVASGPSVTDNMGPQRAIYREAPGDPAISGGGVVLADNRDQLYG